MNRLAAVPKVGHYKRTLAFRLDAELVEWFELQARRLNVSRASILGYALPLVRSLVESGVIDLKGEKRKAVREYRRGRA
jgi:hypothetical protein